MKTFKNILLTGEPVPPYHFRDEFTADLAAGAVNGTLSSDGKAARTVTDTENKLSISGGKLVLAGGKASPAVGDPALWYPIRAKAAGLAILAKVTPELSKNFHVGFDANTAGNPSTSVYFGPTAGLNVIAVGTAVALGTYAAVEYKVAVVQRGTGMLYFIKGGAFTGWTLLYVDPADATANYYPALIGYTSAFTAEFCRLAQLPAPFTSDFGLAIQRSAGARTEGDTFIHPADCLIEWTVTTRVNAQYVTFRMQDATNYWRVDVAADGSIALQEVVDGSATSRGTGAADSVTNGKRIVVIAEGATIKVFANNVLKITYTSATNFVTATAGKLLALGTGGAVAEIVTWPRVLNAGCQAILNRYMK